MTTQELLGNLGPCRSLDKPAMDNEKDSYGQPICNWCKDPRQFMPRIGLCRRCNRFRKDAEQAGALAKKYAEAGREPSPYEEGHQIRRALKRVELAKREGFRYGPSSRQDPIMGLTLEHELDSSRKGQGSPISITVRRVSSRWTSPLRNRRRFFVY